MVVDMFTARCPRLDDARTALTVSESHDTPPAQVGDGPPSTHAGDGPPRWKVLAIPVAVSLLAGLLGGALWAVLAPSEHFFVVAPGRGSALTGESLHRFDSLALFVCVTGVLGIVVPVGFWAWTAARGPLLYAGVLIGSAVGTSAALGLGLGIARLVHPRPDDPVPGTIVSVAPGFESPLVLVVQPLVASLVVLLLVAMNPHDNLRFTDHVDDPYDEIAARSFEPDRA